MYLGPYKHVKELERKFEEETWNPFCEEDCSSEREKNGSSEWDKDDCWECKNDGTSSEKEGNAKEGENEILDGDGSNGGESKEDAAVKSTGKGKAAAEKSTGKGKAAAEKSTGKGKAAAEKSTGKRKTAVKRKQVNNTY